MAEKNQEQKGEEAKASAKTDDKTKAGSEESADEGKAEDAIALLKADHRKVEQLFESYEQVATSSQKSKIAGEVCKELIIHTLIEEEIFYPACRAKIEAGPLDEAQVEHDGAKVMITELIAGAPSDQYYDAKLKVLAEEIKHHVREEEKRDGIFAKAKEAGIDMAELGQRLSERKQELMQLDARDFGPPRTKSFRAQLRSERPSQQEERMERRSSMPDRDEYGRFVSDDDDERGYGSRSYGRGQYSRDEDDYDRGSSGRRSSSGRGRSYDDDDYDRRRSATMRERDEQGRFTSEDEDYGRRRSRSGGSGWYGDPEGHSEASRRGWDERGSHSRARSSRYEDEDEDYARSRSSSMRHRDEQGRFTSEDEDDDRRSSRSRGGHSGWYGDPEGHSEASRRGWDERENGGRSARSRSSRYDDDDRRSSRSRGGHGGWFGDSEGHSEASRRGWDDRR